MPKPPVLMNVLPTAVEERPRWRYTTTRPAADWLKPDFDASAWKEGPAGFGTRNTPGARVRTEWNSADIWLRREFTLPDTKFSDLQLSIHHDEDAEAYINGVLAGSFAGFTTDYEAAPLSAAAKSALKPGKNIIAVHCHQTGGGQYIDVGFADVVPVK
jgi:hypothetical protein